MSEQEQKDRASELADETEREEPDVEAHSHDGRMANDDRGASDDRGPGERHASDDRGPGERHAGDDR